MRHGISLRCVASKPNGLQTINRMIALEWSLSPWMVATRQTDISSRHPRAQLMCEAHPIVAAAFAARYANDINRLRRAALDKAETQLPSSVLPEELGDISFPYTPRAWLDYVAGDKRLKADSTGVVEASVSEVQGQLDGLFDTLTRRRVVNRVAESTENKSKVRDVTVTYMIWFLSPTIGAATAKKVIEGVALGMEADNATAGHIVIPIVVGNAIPSSADLGAGAPLLSFPNCRAYTLVCLLQELLLLPKICHHPIGNKPLSSGQGTYRVRNQVVVISNCLAITDSAVLQAQCAPRQLVKAGASKDKLTGMLSPKYPPPLLEVPDVFIAPVLFHTGHGAGGAGWLPKDSLPNFDPFTKPIDIARIETGLMPAEISLLEEYLKLFIQYNSSN